MSLKVMKQKYSDEYVGQPGIWNVVNCNLPNYARNSSAEICFTESLYNPMQLRRVTATEFIFIAVATVLS